MSIQRIDTVKRRSEMVIQGNTIYIGDQVADDINSDITAQTQAKRAMFDHVMEGKERTIANNLRRQSRGHISATSSMYAELIDTERH